jgi:hypothetical protein
MDEVSWDQRVLLVVANLKSDQDDKLKWLYQWLDENAIRVSKALLHSHYRIIDTLTGSIVTRANFIERVMYLATAPQTEALDVFLVMHGAPGELCFDDGPVRSADLGEQLRGVQLGHRLRLLYSTACYGATHAQDFVKAGFRSASGAVGVCANGPYEFPTQLNNWGKNKTYKSVVTAGNNPLFLTIHDAAAKTVGFSDVNSEKVIFGKMYTRITSPAV